MTSSAWGNRRVLLTGVTGFKGSWLAILLRELGAVVRGYSLPPPTRPSLFATANLDSEVDWVEGDVRDLPRLRRVVTDFAPEIVFHLAAQPLVRASYDDPVDTFSTNVLGTVNVLESLRGAPGLKAIVVVTTDKCYENREWAWPYREADPLGGHDPYSSSKACAEIATSAYHRSFFEGVGVGVSTARAGNVIGGGDWAADRLVPDIFRQLRELGTVTVRNPASVRPWQHVLEPLGGYLALAEHLASDPRAYSEAWNFGPDADSVVAVSEIATTLCRLLDRPGAWQVPQQRDAGRHEAATLTLDSSKARRRLDWRPRLNLGRALEWTVEWQRVWESGGDVREMCRHQIQRYLEKKA